ncbi:MAG TPA: type II toxin-antitoxin system HigB family toxin [Gemmataceae bacterium]|nr:type II toxin-antitoxin system HigB family toxin [Gemmataceae bacterium]
MRVFSKKALRDFWLNPKHRRSQQPLMQWYQVVSDAEWRQFSDVRKTFNNCDQVGSKVVFDVGGNNYRIIAVIDYERQRVYVRAVLDHKEYDKGTWKNDTFGDDWIPFKKMLKNRPGKKKL